MNKTITLLTLFVFTLGYSQENSITITTEDVAINGLFSNFKFVEEKTANIPIYKDTLIETTEYKGLNSKMNTYKEAYNRWLNQKKTNEEFNTDIASIVNNLETFVKSKEDYLVTKPLIETAQILILKNKICYLDGYGRSNNELIILSKNGKKPQKTRSFMDDVKFETPLEICLRNCKSLNKLNEPEKSQNVINYIELEEQMAATKRYENKRLPTDKIIAKKGFILNRDLIIPNTELIGAFTISLSKYVLMNNSEGYAENELVEIALSTETPTPKNTGSEILTNIITGKKYISTNSNILTELESKRKEIVLKQQALLQISKYGTVYYDKERESDMLKIQSGTLKLSSYNLKDIPELVPTYNSLYTKMGNIVKQMPPHIVILKKYYNLFHIQGRNMSQANISAWSKAINNATPIRESMQKLVMDNHFSDYGFYPKLKYEGTDEDFDLYYNAALTILGL